MSNNFIIQNLEPKDILTKNDLSMYNQIIKGNLHLQILNECLYRKVKKF